ncbi:MAG: pilus assembly protein PilM [Rhodocyclaceae bacterium]|nr:pilus assembly protein PilM [Rhodocyclaceae bacterium]MDZ4215086.1 pilus assembly protein PilM [Rhodocyclaceae bacterium]
MSFINRILKPGGKQGWCAVEASPDGLFGVSVAAPAQPGGKPVVVACAHVADTPLDAQSLTSLATAMDVEGATWTVPLDRKSYSILVVEEPAVRADEMEQSVRWAISTMIDFPINDAAVSWMRIPTDKLLPNRPPHIYVVATRRELVEQHRQIFKQAKLHLGAIDVQETAHRNMAALLAKSGEGVAMLSVGKRGVQFTITFQGELYLDRNVDEMVFGNGADDDAVLDRARERVVLQVQRSLDFVGRTLPFIDIGRVVLAPMPGETQLLERIAENLPVAVEALNLGSIFDLSRTPTLLGEASQAGYFVALGSALRFMSTTA